MSKNPVQQSTSSWGSLMRFLHRAAAWLLVVLWFICAGCGSSTTVEPENRSIVAQGPLRNLLVAAVPPRQSQRMQTADTLKASLTVIPPAITTPTQLVDIRLGLANPSSQPQQVTVQFYATLIHPTRRIMTEARTVSLSPESVTLVSTPWAPVAFQGRQSILAVVQREGQPDMALSWPLHILPSASSSAGVPFFTAAWLEPGALGFFPWHTITQDDIRRLVRNYRDRGITTLAIAYPEYGGCFYYPSTLQLRWADYTGCPFNTRTYFYDCELGPKNDEPWQPWRRTLPLGGSL